MEVLINSLFIVWVRILWYEMPMPTGCSPSTNLMSSTRLIWFRWTATRLYPGSVMSSAIKIDLNSIYFDFPISRESNRKADTS